MAYPGQMALNSFSAARIWPIECCIDPVGPTTAHPVIEAASAMPVNQYLECLVLRKPIVRNSNFEINPAGIKAQERPVAKDYCTNGRLGHNLHSATPPGSGLDSPSPIDRLLIISSTSLTPTPSKFAVCRIVIANATVAWPRRLT